MPIQNSDPAKQAMVAQQLTQANLYKTSTCDTHADYVDRLFNGELTLAESDDVYNSVFETKTNKDGDPYLDDKDRSFDYVTMVNYLIETLSMKAFASRETPAMPKRVVMDVGGRYVPAHAMVPTMVNYLSRGIAKEKSVKDVIYAIANDIHVRAYFEDMQTNTRRANFLNGVVDISGDDVVLAPRDDDDVFFTRVPHNYPTGGGECPVFQEFLDYALETKYHQFIYEWIGYCFFETYEFQNILFHHGVGGSGKSTLLKLVAVVLGPSNISSVSLKQAAHEKFSLNALDGALANHGSEVSYKDLKDGGEILKQLSSGVDPVLVEQKYEKAYPIVNTAKLTYAMNNLPGVYHEDSGLWRRLILVEWKKAMGVVDGRRFNSSEDGMLAPDEINGVIYKSIHAFHAMVKRGEGFSYSPAPMDVESDYAVKSDTVGAFVYDCIDFSDTNSTSYRSLEANDGGDWEANVDIYTAYKEWCLYNGVETMKPNTFTSKHGLSKELDKTVAIRSRQKHDGKYQVRGWKHIKLTSIRDGIQTGL